MTSDIKLEQDGSKKFVQDFLSRSRNFQGAFARIYPLYQRLQTQRFQTAGASEGMVWEPNTLEYARRKLRMYGGGDRRASAKRASGNWNTYPGKGQQLLIATGMLAGSVIGPGSPFESGAKNHRAMFTSMSMEISVEMSGQNPEGKEFDYAAYVADRRPFMQFSDASIALMRETLKQYILKGI